MGDAKYTSNARGSGDPMTVKELMERYLEVKSKRHEPNTQKALITVYKRVWNEVGHLPARELSREEAQRMASDWVDEYSAATVRYSLASISSVWKWALKRQEVPANIWTELDLEIGKSNKGKTQLMPDEAAVLVAACLEELERDPRSDTLAILMNVFLGLRASEICNMKGKAINMGGACVVVRPEAQRGGKLKTDSASRPLEVAAVLQPHLARRKELVGPEETLFSCPNNRRRVPLNRHTFHKYLQDYCRKLGLTTVCPHGLRGTHSSLAFRAGATSEMVALTLGHAGARMPTQSVTHQHYIKKEVANQRQLHSVEQALTYAKSGVGK